MNLFYSNVGNQPAAYQSLERIRPGTPASGQACTPEALEQIMRELAGGAVFERHEAYGPMQECWNRFGFHFDRAALRAPGWPIQFGLGMMRFQLRRLVTPLRPMPAVLGHTGSTGTWLFHCPRLDLLTAGTVDQVTPGPVPFRLVPRLLRLCGWSRNR